MKRKAFKKGLYILGVCCFLPLAVPAVCFNYDGYANIVEIAPTGNHTSEPVNL